MEFFSVGDDKSRSFTTPGREQTNNRVELLAAIVAMRVQDGNLEIRYDTDCVVRIATGILQRETQLNNESDADLWDEFVTKLRAKATRQLSFVWIKRHATKIHISRRSPPLWTREETMMRTHWRLLLRHHAAQPAMIEAATKRQRVALATHIFVADLLLQRRDFCVL